MKAFRSLCFLLLFLMPTASFARVMTYEGQPIAAASAGSNQTSAWIDTGHASDCSFELIWASLASTLDGQFVVEVSNNASTATAKTSASLNISSANGNDMLSLNGVITEKFYRIKWVKNTVASGTVTVNAACKG